MREALILGLLFTSYELPGKHDIIHDSDRNFAELQRFEVNAKYGLLTVPRIKNKVLV